jgi:FAD/FMN-containing dehydrogenase
MLYTRHRNILNFVILGHATTGGLAALSRKLGLVLDTIVEAEVVTASGDILTTNEQKDPDLFWVGL